MKQPKSQEHVTVINFFPPCVFTEGCDFVCANVDTKRSSSQTKTKMTALKEVDFSVFCFVCLRGKKYKLGVQ